ncbi:MAG: PP2C family protein-serine/threonine phosphatase [Coriobacteriales bacterium]|nr:PP2C family protein-serine/threonine phosphatase [Coriobacteriales bacterium]
MTGQLSRTSSHGMGEASQTNALIALLALTSDAVLIFGQDGVVTLANENAERLFRVLPGGLVGSDVRLLFPPAATIDAMEGSPKDSLPFSLDGATNMLVCEGSAHVHRRVLVRCEMLAGSVGAYLLTARPAALEGSKSLDDERLVEELSRANRRLSGTLDIVLGTLDALDLGMLFSRTLDKLSQTMDAWGTLAYMAEQSGYRLRGATASVEDAYVPSYLSYAHPLADAVVKERHSVFVRVLPPSRESLRAGDTENRVVLDEASGEKYTIPYKALPPFASFAMVPVWFGGHVISLLLVGWRHTYGLRRDDLRLLEGVAEYLSVQLAGAFASMRAQHEDRLESLGTMLREQLLAKGGPTKELLRRVFDQASAGIYAACVPLEANVYQRTTMGEFPSLGYHSVAVDSALLDRAKDSPAVRDVSEFAGLSDWLKDNGEPSQGLLALVGVFEGTPMGFLLLRQEDDEPFEDVDVSFVSRLVQDVHEVEIGAQARIQDKRISQALQLGMKNELQRVEGLSTQSRYSSATEAAYVGGDFYDLVRLPHHRACAIMGDVSGKGVEAASVSSAVKTALGAYAWEGLKPARMVSLLNDFLLGFSRIETFATMFVGVVDIEHGTLTYCSAGHPPAMLVRATTHELVSLGVQSGVVGAFEGLTYKDGEVELGAGDILVLYTDGVTEARDPSGAFFGEDGLRDAILREVGAGFDGLCDRIQDAVSDFTQNSLDDDVALVLIRFDHTG